MRIVARYGGTALYTNAEVAERLREMAAALKMVGASRFEAQAYDKAARGVDTYPDALARMWEAGRLKGGVVPGVGGSIAQHLDELFRTGRVASWEELTGSIPEVIFELLRIPGVGQVTAWKLARAGVEDLEDLGRKLEGGLAEAGFSSKDTAKIGQGLAELNRRPERMLLPVAEAVALPLLAALRELPGVMRADLLGSLRRRTATVGNINLGLMAEEPGALLDRLDRLPAVMTVERAGETAAALTLHGGQRVDLRAGIPAAYGALLVWFTGSPGHVGGLAHRAEERRLRLTPEGLIDEAFGLTLPMDTEEAVYERLGLAWIPPELREDRGELAAAAAGTLPDLLSLDDLRGDCHTHTRWSDGRDSLREMAQAAQARGHQYLVVTDHSYPNLDFAARSAELAALRRDFPRMPIVDGLEVNITVDGGLQVPDDVLARHQFCLASIHTGFRQPREVITRRLLAALAHPSINGIAHPTGRLLLRREGIDADWDAVFDACLAHDKFLEIDGPAERADLPDDLVREAVRRGVKLTVDSDAHATEELANQAGGVQVARRGWVEARHVLNALPWDDFKREARVR